MRIKEVRLPYHRLLHKYKEFHNMQNIVVGQGELPYVANLNGWRTPHNTIIYDRDEAIQYATKLDKYINEQRVRFIRFKKGDRY